MSCKFLAFDIETAKQIPDDFSDWRKHRPLGICCAATVAGDLGEPKVCHGVNADGRPAASMSATEVGELVKYLREMSEQDARCTLDLAEACESSGRLRWISRRSGSRDMPLQNGWLSVVEALKLPLQDTSWMTNPVTREQLTEWIG